MIKKPNTKQPELQEITEQEFLSTIQDTIDLLEDEIGSLISSQTQFIRLYRNYIRDKEFSHLKYYTNGSEIMYKANNKHVGFMYDKRTKQT